MFNTSYHFPTTSHQHKGVDPSVREYPSTLHLTWHTVFTPSWENKDKSILLGYLYIILWEDSLDVQRIQSR